MRRNCNPNLAKATDPLYECNHKTGRWIKKKNKECDPSSRRARDPAYECNPKTGRWIKKTTPKQCNASSPKADNPLYECNPKTGRWIKKKSAAAAPPAQPIQPWSTRCKTMEQKCPMDCDLGSNEWCSLPNDSDVIFFSQDGTFYCYRVDEIIQNLHREFTSLDTSYQVPPLRLKIPTDAYTRNFIPIQFFHLFKQTILAHPPQVKNIPHEILYFLKYYPELYKNPAIRPFLNKQNNNAVQESKLIQNFFDKHKEIEYKYVKPTEIKWTFRLGKVPKTVAGYLKK